MTVLAVFRFCGIGYFANEYEEQEVPAYMQTMWDEEHAEYVEKVAKAKYALDMAKK